MQQISKIIGVIVLIIIIAGAVWLQKNSKQPANQPQANNTQSKSALEELGPAPAESSPAADKDAFAVKLRLLAQSVNTIEIGKECQFSPQLITVKSGSKITFKNQDDAEHGISILEEIRIQPHTEKTIAATFNGAGVYGVTCDGPNIAGFINVEE